MTLSHLNAEDKVFLSTFSGSSDPKFFDEAVSNSKWYDATNLELRALERNDSWSITSLPFRKKAIGYKWLYKTKFNLDGTIERYKARLVILGCRQQYGVDY